MWVHKPYGTHPVRDTGERQYLSRRGCVTYR